MKLPFPYHQKKALRFQTVVGGILIAVLFVSTAMLAYLYWKERKERDSLLTRIQATQKRLDQVSLSLSLGEMKRASDALGEAQQEMVALLPSAVKAAPTATVALRPAPPPPTPPPASRPPAETPVKPPQASPVPPSSVVAPKPAPPLPAPTPALQPPAAAPGPASPSPAPPGLTLAADETPYPLLWAEADEHLLLAEKEQKVLHLFRYSGSGFALLKSYPCIVGANGFDKKREGDLATPVGVYFTLRYIPGKSLPEKYGHGAFVLNYPNFLDRKARKDGKGIWLHGHTPGKSLGDPELQNTKGCIAVRNDVVRELTGLIKASGAPVVVVNRLQASKTSDQRHAADELNTFLKGWAKAWESANIKAFMNYYAPDFMSADGMNYQAFKRQKERVNSGKKFIRVQIEAPVVVLVQDERGQIAVIRFTQRYRSNNFESNSRKIFYLKKGPGGWQIIGESRL